jgi:hypothetical protein
LTNPSFSERLRRSMLPSRLQHRGSRDILVRRILDPMTR